MTRKDYEAIASKIAWAATWADHEASEHDRDVARAAVSLTAGQIAEALADDNPRFDRGRFLTACGVTR